MTRGLALLLLAVALAAVACSRKDGAHAEPSGAGPRVVSLSPSTTETMFAIGAGALLVGRSRYCDYPKEALVLPAVAGFTDVDFEAILALRPGLVIGARGPLGSEITQRLEGRGVQTFFPKTESFAEIDAMILGVGQRTGHVSEAAQVTTALDAQVLAVTRAVASLPPKRVLLLFGIEPLSAAGPSSFADEMVTRAGGTNVVMSGGAYPAIDMETVLKLDPDVVLNADMSGAHGASTIHRDAPGWRSLRAVKEDHVVALTDETVLRPGPRIADGLTVMARAIHPEAELP